MSDPYTVRVAAAAARDLDAQVEYIAVSRQEPLNAVRWLGQVRSAIRSLSMSPSRAAVARHTAALPYEVRQLVVWSHLVLFTIDDEERTVHVLRVWPAKRQPQDDDLPSTAEGLEE